MPNRGIKAGEDLLLIYTGHVTSFDWMTVGWILNDNGQPRDASHIVAYSGSQTAVPEPGTWAMMLVGFGAAGYSMRRRRKVVTQLA